MNAPKLTIGFKSFNVVLTSKSLANGSYSDIIDVLLVITLSTELGDAVIKVPLKSRRDADGTFSNPVIGAKLKWDIALTPMMLVLIDQAFQEQDPQKMWELLPIKIYKAKAKAKEETPATSLDAKAQTKIVMDAYDKKNS